MKMAILELEYKNIRKITALKLPFTKADGSVISNNFIMMANGTGKTTTMELIKGLFDGTAAGWTASKVRSFAPTLTEADTGEFSITVKFDDRQYKYFLSMNYKDGTVQVETSAPPKGREAGLRLPESIRGIFTPEFVRRFVFDGEQAAKSMDSSSIFIPHPNSRRRSRKLRSATEHLARRWESRSVGWCSGSSTQKTVLRRTPPSTALSPDLNWRGNSPWN